MKNINYRFVLMNNYELIDEEVINYLYQPIMGINAASLYKIAISESKISKKFTKQKIFSNMSRIESITGLNSNEIIKSFSILEGMGLLSKFIKKTQKSDIVYNIYRPLDPIDFFKNENFNNILYKKIGEQEYEFTRMIFSDEPMPIIEEEYEEKTAKFSDIFIDKDVLTRTPKFDFSVKLRKTNPLLKDLKLNDISKFFEKNNVCFSQEDEEIVGIIKTIYSSFKLKSKEIAEILIDCYNYNYHKFDIDKIESLINRMFLKQMNNKADNEIGIKQNQMNIYDSELYAIKLLEINELSENTKDLINSLRNKYILTDPVINCLLDYSYLKCSNTIQYEFVCSIAKTLSSKNIMNTNDAMEYLKKLKSN